MAEVKIMAIIGNFLGYPLLGFTIWINLQSWKSDILFILSGLFLAVKIYFYIRKQSQDVKSRDLSLFKKEHEIEKEIEDEETKI